MTEHVACPDPACQAPAEVVARRIWPSTDGPVEHLKTCCLRGHWLTPMADRPALLLRRGDDAHVAGRRPTNR